MDIPPYDHPVTIAGQGTWVLEALEDGAGTWARWSCRSAAAGSRRERSSAWRPRVDARVYGVEPAGADDTRRSIEAGHGVPVGSPVDRRRAAGEPAGRDHVRVLRTGLAGALTVTDDEIIAAMRMLWERAKQVVEPGGATAFAAVLAGRVPADRAPCS